MYYNMDEIYYSRIFNEAYKNIKKYEKIYIYFTMRSRKYIGIHNNTK